VLAHWDEVESYDEKLGHLGGDWTPLGRAAGTKGIGLSRVQVDPGTWSSPLHRETADEEIFFVLAGSGISLQDDKAHEVRAGDCIVHLAGREAHSLRAGDEGLDYLVYSNRRPAQKTVYPRLEARDDPWDRESALGPPDVPELSGRPPNILNLDEVEGEFGGSWKRLGRDAGAEQTGLNWGRLDPGEEDDSPHCHSADEEIHVVLDGDGTLFLGDEEHAVRTGHVIYRPPATGIAHGWRAGDEGMTVLFYGTREPNDIIYYPRTNEIYFKGVRVTQKL
jgi:uncharacterized cupin superfamily protein